MSKLRSASAILCLFVFANAWGSGGIEYIRTLDTDQFFDGVNPNGIAFPPRANSLLVLPNTFVLFQKGGKPGDPNTLSLPADPITVTYDDRTRRLFWLKPESNELDVIYLRGQFKTEQFAIAEYGVTDTRGIAVDPKDGTLFILDGDGSKITRIVPRRGRKDYDGAAALQEGRISELSLSGGQGLKLRGLGFNHADRSLYAASENRQGLFQITEAGELVFVGTFSEFGRIDVKGLVFVRSLDQTDNPKCWHAFIASSGGPSGQVSEWSMTPCVSKK